MVVSEPKRSIQGGRAAVSVTIQAAGATHEVWYRLSEDRLALDSNAFLAASLAPAMRLGGPLRIEGSVSSRLLASVPKIQDILNLWDRQLKRVPVEGEVMPAPRETRPRGVGCFFSGGVDSFYTLLKHQDEITHLIFVHGFDVALDDAPLYHKVLNGIREAAAELEKPLIEVETNVRGFADPLADWAYFYHGSAMASVALLLSPLLKKVYLAASHTYNSIRPWGSYPLLDPLWNTEEMELVHDGCEATRMDKVARISACDTALRWLRVCWENREGAYNCGRCEKCLRTMVNLRLAGVLDRCTTFEHPLDLEAVSRIVPGGLVRHFVEESLKVAEDRGNDPALAEALRESLRRAGPPNDDQVDSLYRQLREKDAENSALKALVAGYESGRVMKVLLASERLKQRLLRRDR
ncbi:MAG: hypothetical protein HY675_20375 [Chloroflexi bacterium]|nr:hypothetical protein [Chloroflexota bacterium]